MARPAAPPQRPSAKVPPAKVPPAKAPTAKAPPAKAPPAKAPPPKAPPPAGRATRGLGRPLGSDSGERRRQIVEAARRCFATNGYAGTTNRQIADGAGITTGAIYHYFESKLELYLEVFEQTDRVILERYAELLEDPGRSLGDRIEGLLMKSTELNAEDQSLAAFIVVASFEAQRDQDLAATYRAHDQRISRFLNELIDVGTADALRPGVDRADVLNVLRVLTLGLTWCSLRLHDPEAHTELTRSAVRLVRGEVLAAARPRRRSPVAASRRSG